MTGGLGKKLSQVYLGSVMTAYALVILLASAPPPFVDYPDWVYQGVLFHALITGHPVAGYAIKHYPVPNSLTTVGIGFLNTLLPWQWAAKVWVCLYLTLAGVATWLLARVRSRWDWQLAVAAPGIVFVNLNFWYGHISFEIGVCLVVILLVMLLRNASTLCVMGVLVALFFTHMEACAGDLLLVGIWYIDLRQWKRLWSIIPTIALTLWYAVARFNSGNRDGLGLQSAPIPMVQSGF